MTCWTRVTKYDPLNSRPAPRTLTRPPGRRTPTSGPTLPLATTDQDDRSAIAWLAVWRSAVWVRPMPLGLTIGGGMIRVRAGSRPSGTWIETGATAGWGTLVWMSSVAPTAPVGRTMSYWIAKSATFVASPMFTEITDSGTPTSDRGSKWPVSSPDIGSGWT